MLKITLKSVPSVKEEVKVNIQGVEYNATIIDFNPQGFAVLSVNLGDITDTFDALYTVEEAAQAKIKLLRGLRYTQTVLLLVESVTSSFKPANESNKYFIQRKLKVLTKGQIEELTTKNIHYNGYKTLAFEF